MQIPDSMLSLSASDSLPEVTKSHKDRKYANSELATHPGIDSWNHSGLPGHVVVRGARGEGRNARRPRTQSHDPGREPCRDCGVIPAGRESSGLEQLARQFTNRDHLLGIGIYSADGSPLVVARPLGNVLSPPPQMLRDALASNRTQSRFMPLHFRLVYLLTAPLHGADNSVTGAIVVVHDATYIQTEILRIWAHTFVRMALQVLVIVVITLLILRQSLARPVARVEQWMKALRTGRHATPPSASDMSFLGPVAREVAPLAESLQRARASAETEARLRNTNESVWTAERLADRVRHQLDGSNLFVVSNREPYIHNRHGNEIAVIVPASGVVTAIEPILCACNGTWIAHGSGDADMDTVDAHSRLQVPPHDPRYTPARGCGSAPSRRTDTITASPTRPLAAVPHRAYAAHVPHRDWQHYRAVKREICRRGGGGDRGRRKSRGSAAGLSLCAAAAIAQGAFASRQDRNLLAYSVAELGVVRHLPMAAGTPGWTSGRRLDRIPRAGPLQ